MAGIRESESASEVPVLLTCRGPYAEIGAQAKEKGEQGNYATAADAVLLVC